MVQKLGYVVSSGFKVHAIASATKGIDINPIIGKITNN